MICSRCRMATRWIPQYGRFWCDRCTLYPEPLVLPPPPRSNRTVWIALAAVGAAVAVVVIVVLARHSGGRSNADRMHDTVDQICACPDSACLMRVTAAAEREQPDHSKLEEEDLRRLEACMEQIQRRERDSHRTP